MVSNKLNNASSGKEVIIAQADERGDVYMDDGPVEDEFDFSMEYDIVIIRWAVTNSSCEQATHGNRSKYACRSGNSDCKNVIHGISLQVFYWLHRKSIHYARFLQQERGHFYCRSG